MFFQKSLRLNTFSQNYTMYIHMLIIQIQSISLQKLINNNTDTTIRRILICSSVWRACTWKIVFNTENNEINELSECILYKIFCFFGKHLKTVKLSFTRYFPKALLAYVALKVSKTFHNFLLACFTLLCFKSF